MFQVIGFALVILYNLLLFRSWNQATIRSRFHSVRKVGSRSWGGSTTSNRSWTGCSLTNQLLSLTPTYTSSGLPYHSQTSKFNQSVVIMVIHHILSCKPTPTISDASAGRRTWFPSTSRRNPSLCKCQVVFEDYGDDSTLDAKFTAVSHFSTICISPAIFPLILSSFC